MKPEIKIEGDNLIVVASYAHAVDADADGAASAKIEGSLKLTLDGSEIIDELIKNVDFLAKIKAKIGM